jgi:hypothetical protein
MAGSAYRLWLLTGMYPAMSVGMLVYLAWRRDEHPGQKHPGSLARQEMWKQRIHR